MIMASKHSTARTKKPTTDRSQERPLTDAELQRITERLAGVLFNDSEDIALLTILLNHLERQPSIAEVANSVDAIKKHLFTDTNEADIARRAFQATALKNRGTLLLWPSERRKVS
jgi:hypothetical protein